MKIEKKKKENEKSMMLKRAKTKMQKMPMTRKTMTMMTKKRKTIAKNRNGITRKELISDREKRITRNIWEE